MSDEINSGDRNFFEQTRFKVVSSVVIASIGLSALAFCSAYAGQADASRIVAKESSGTSKDYNESLSAGYGKRSPFSIFVGTFNSPFRGLQSGFAAFIFILAAIIFVAGSIYMSPLCCGTAREREVLMTTTAKHGKWAGNTTIYFLPHRAEGFKTTD
jgi:membrane carboxypeptidase/penicillin-binding protein PbpC